jgi:hypothetical protein
LEALYKSCGGADWTGKDGWMTEAELGEWYGVEVDAEGRVVELRMYGNNLAGALPSEIQQLSALKVLNLCGGSVKRRRYNNNLTGAIPAELGQLGALTMLDLSFNQLSEVIPAELAQLPALAHLWLCGNQLSGQEAFRGQMQEHNPECTLVLAYEDTPSEDEDLFISSDDEEESE